MRFKQFELDDFQVKAIESLDKGHSVVVSAATGTGKTLIADYIIDKAMANNQRVFYTAPIKALSNQKYRDFKADYGEDRVGIVTGDVQINTHAQVIVMTTEIYRNMLLSRDPETEEISYVIFDEIHFISDLERGTIWEESIIFSPKQVRFVCLSATIPNARDFAAWISSIKRHQVDVVMYDKRAVPLTHLVYERGIGLDTAEALKRDMDRERQDERRLGGGAPGREGPGGGAMRGQSHKRLEHRRGPHGRQQQQARRQGQQAKYGPRPASHVDLVRELRQRNLLPTIFFVFSRNMCEEKAEELAKGNDFLTREEKATVVHESIPYLEGEIKTFQSTRFIRAVLGKGVGVHHAGMLPKLKELVEHLFGMGLVKVLYATETFAVGINMPARSVCFHSLDKFDGMSFRYLNSKEYFQLAGRAGRRGIDKVGYAIALVNREFVDIEAVIRLSQRDIEPIVSRFELSINTVLNLVHNHTNRETEIILKSNFDYFQKRSRNIHVRILASFNNKIKLLLKMGYIATIDPEAALANPDRTYYLTEKGLFARHIYSNEILITEIFGTALYRQFNPLELDIIIAALIYEGRRADKFDVKGVGDTENSIMRRLAKNPYLLKEFPRANLRKLINLVSVWSRTEYFEDLTRVANLAEGDFIRLFRQMLDFERQISKAAQDFELQELMKQCMYLIDKGIVKVEF